jgi:hypothetical protein
VRRLPTSDLPDLLVDRPSAWRAIFQGEFDAHESGGRRIPSGVGSTVPPSVVT